MAASKAFLLVAPAGCILQQPCVDVEGSKPAESAGQEVGSFFVLEFSSCWQVNRLVSEQRVPFY